MIIHSVELKNFYRFGNKEQKLDLSGSGITAITGFNGYGKSTALIDSLIFALFGQYRCDSIDNVVNRYTSKDCKISVNFSQDGEEYKVIRYRKHTTHKNNVYLFKGEQDISGHTAAETNVKIIDLIKMNYISFINSSVFSTELYSAFLAKKESERLVIFENILSLKEINLFYTEIKKVLKELGDEYNEDNLTATGINSEISVIENTISDYSNNAKKKLLQLKEDKERAKSIIEEAKKAIENYSVIDINKEKEKLLNNTLKDEYEKKLTELKLQTSSLIVKDDNDALLIVNKYKDINFEENKLKEERYKEDIELLNTRKNGYKTAQQQINSLTKEKENLNRDLTIKEERQIENRKKLNKLSEAVCPFCGQHLESEKVELETKKLLEEQKVLIDEIEEIQEKLKEMNTTLEEQRDNYKWLLADYNKINENLNKDFIPNTELIIEQYKNAIKVVDEINKQKKENEEKINSINDEINNYKSKIELLETSKFTEEELNSISVKIEEQNKIIADNEIVVAQIDASAKTVFDKSYIEGLKKQQEEKEKEYDKIKTKLDKMKKLILHYEYLGECFSNKSGGFKKFFIGEMIDLFNDRINRYLPFFFTEKVQISFDKNLTDTITMDDFEVSFSSFSQGQRQRAELAIAFALFDVARVFFKNDNKLICLDEMDKGLDKAGLKAMINVLEGFDKQLKIFIVSHNPLLLDEVNDFVKIERDENGFSVIKQ